MTSPHAGLYSTFESLHGYSATCYLLPNRNTVGKIHATKRSTSQPSQCRKAEESRGHLALEFHHSARGASNDVLGAHMFCRPAASSSSPSVQQATSRAHFQSFDVRHKAVCLRAQARNLGAIIAGSYAFIFMSSIRVCSQTTDCSEIEMPSLLP